MANKKSKWKINLLPREKGGWGVIGEPVLLGLVAAFSIPGLLVGLAAFVSLLARQPAYKLYTNYKHSGKSIFPQVFWLVLMWMSMILILFAAFFLNNFNAYFLVPMFIALIPSFWQLKSDVMGDSRDIRREIISSALPGCFASSIGILGGLNTNTAWVLWVLVSARTIPTILYVKGRVDITHRKTPDFKKIIFAQFAALFLTGMLSFWGLIPELSLLVIAGYTLRAVAGLKYPRASTTIKKLGYTELSYGLLGMVLMGVSFAAV